MSDESKQILRSSQCARIIVCISEMFEVPLDEATDIFYSSETAGMIVLICIAVVTGIWLGKFGENTKKVKKRQTKINL